MHGKEHKMPKQDLGTLALDPTEVAPLGAYNVSGSGYTPGGSADLYIQTPLPATVTINLVFDADGNFSLDTNADGSTGTYYHTVIGLVHHKHVPLSDTEALTVA